MTHSRGKTQERPLLFVLCNLLFTRDVSHSPSVNKQLKKKNQTCMTSVCPSHKACDLTLRHFHNKVCGCGVKGLTRVNGRK